MFIVYKKTYNKKLIDFITYGKERLTYAYKMSLLRYTQDYTM